MIINRFFFIISVIGLLFLLSLGKARLETNIDSLENDDSYIPEAPIPPLEGRKGEKGMSAFLFKPEIDFSSWMKRGKRYFQQREYEQAIWAFRKAVHERPCAPEAHFLLGCSYSARGEQGLPGDQTAWEELSEKELNAAIKVGDFLPARFNLGILLTKLGRADEARPHFEHILSVSPNSQLGKAAASALDRNISSDLMPNMLSVKIPDKDVDKRIGSIAPERNAERLENAP
ncbi:MAG: tetratricopeptide repeat protein [Candidatus Riflebacteria bacterium]|nr:tetratricopeptide repeat protein [Candidatus Riflebacteria bacterium]